MLMTEEAVGGELTGNTFVGSGANMVLFGHKNAGDVTVANNTFAFSGYSALALSFRDYRVHDNVFFTGHPKPAYGTKGYVGDRNLFWHGQGLSGRTTVLASDDGFHTSLDAFRRAMNQDAASEYADPKFRNAPVAYTVLDEKKLSESSREKLHLRGGTGSAVMAGDYIEINFDGASITISPPLDKRPTKAWRVANWADKTDFTLDLRNAPRRPRPQTRRRWQAGRLDRGRAGLPPRRLRRRRQARPAAGARRPSNLSKPSEFEPVPRAGTVQQP